MVSEARGVESALPDHVRDVAIPGSLSEWQLILQRLSRQRLAVAAVFALLVLCSLALCAEVVAPYGPHQRHIEYAYAPPQSVHFDFVHGLHTYALQRYVDPVTFRKQYLELPGEPLRVRLFQAGQPYALWGLIPMQRHLFSARRDPLDVAPEQKLLSGEPAFFVLGADRYGRDVFSRSLYGARISLSVGLIGLVCTFLLGVVIGGISGYVGGRTDKLIARGIEVVNVFPQLPLAIALTAMLPRDWSAHAIYFSITLLLGLLNWTGLARVVRGQILSLREEEYATAARLMGASHSRILFRHLLPGCTSHIIVALTLSVPGMILAETALSLLGLGLRPPVLSWGVMLQDCLDVKAVRFYPWLLTPVAFITSVLLSFNFLGDALRDAADPYN